MDTVLALTWRITAGDFARFEALYPFMRKHYCGISIYAPPDCNPDLIAAVAAYDGVKLSVSPRRADNRRYRTIRQALDFPDAAFIHLCDGDHALVRMTDYRDDWMRTLDAIHQPNGTDCLIIGRSGDVFKSYPASLRETERIINLVGSHLLGQPVDLGSGARGFSRRAAEYLIAYASPTTHPVAVDAEYPVLLHRAGFRIRTIESTGAIYEVHCEAHAEQLASADQWAKRVALARVIIEAGIDAAKRTDLPEVSEELLMLQIDHVIIAVRDLDAASDDYTALGFNVIYGGRHASGSTHNGLICFQDGTYLELLAPTGDAAQAGSTDFSPLLAKGEGLVGYALGSHNLLADTAELRARGVTVGEISEGKRERQDGIELRWYTASIDGGIDSGIDSGMSPFLIEDITPRYLRVPDDANVTNHANGVTGIRELVGADLSALSGNQTLHALKLKASQPISFDPAKTHGVLLTAEV